MSRWAEAFAALSGDRDTMDTTRHSRAEISIVSQIVKSVTLSPALPHSSIRQEPDDPTAIWTERIRSLRCPKDFSPERWERLRDGALLFAQESAAQAIAAGWTEEELFRIEEPFANLSRHGVVWFIGNKEVIDVTAAAITLRTASGANQRIYRRDLQ